MRKIIDWGVLITVAAIGGYLIYQHPAQVRGLISMIEARVAPCSSPITYSIGSIDPRFGISETKVRAQLRAAETMWEEPSGKDLFEYVANGGAVTVDFVYDERQAATDKLETLGMVIDESKGSYEELKAQYDSLGNTIEAKQSAYKQKIAAYEEREAAYNAQVEKWNAEGGAPPREYAKLTAEKAALQREVARIKTLERELNEDIDTFNALATTLNQLIVRLNLNVRQYNQTGAKGGEFEEGLYELQNGVETITIYEFSNTTKLVRVLAHEFGHALDLDHVEDEKAIMYEINKGTALKATDADVAELNSVCRTKS